MIFFLILQDFVKFRSNSAQKSTNSSEISTNLAGFGRKNWQTFQRFSNKILSFENGAKECILQILARAFQRILTCKIWLRYSRERALQSFFFQAHAIEDELRKDQCCLAEEQAIENAISLMKKENVVRYIEYYQAGKK